MTRAGEKPCHHSNSRRFKCACGKTTEWMHEVYIQACSNSKCRRMHVRGPMPSQQVTECPGYDPIPFSVAVDMARYDFLRAMLQFGFAENKDGYTNLTNHNKPNSNHEGFTSQITSHFSGTGKL